MVRTSVITIIPEVPELHSAIPVRILVILELCSACTIVLTVQEDSHSIIFIVIDIDDNFFSSNSCENNFNCFVNQAQSI